jgi:hypothetical protein
MDSHRGWTHIGDGFVWGDLRRLVLPSISKSTNSLFRKWGGETALEMTMLELLKKFAFLCESTCRIVVPRTSASNNVDVLSCREPPSEIKRDPTQAYSLRYWHGSR